MTEADGEACRQCGSLHNSKVYDSRERGTTMLRRRKCLSCEYRWATFEVRVDTFEKLVEMQACIKALAEGV